VRADYTGAPLKISTPGYYVNPAAFVAPSAGRWGTAARNSVTGPPQFSLNLGVMRTFSLGNRWSADWRLDAVNVLNRVTYSSIETRVGSPQFGLANRANPMRKLQSSLRFRF
jgi:trimeric autotransporter adhesin